ncbi:hypothetical protein FACS1894192_10660 [Bacilli bacterium]|nr:hypothetical protein FACS1894192_10660 [Bacilli bacterium]GHU45292.1 hypothetical protein FACS1894194_0750 [Bacilli bacterium]
MDKKKLALISVATLLSFGVTGFVSADETVTSQISRSKFQLFRKILIPVIL